MDFGSDTVGEPGESPAGGDDPYGGDDPGSYESPGTKAFLAQIDRTQKALANMQGIPPTQKAPQDESIPGDRFGGDEDPGFLSGIGTLFTKGFDALGSFVDYTLANPISSVVNTAINYSPPGLAANAISMATTGRSLAGHGSDMLGSLGLGVPSDVSPIAAGVQGVAQDIASSSGGLFDGTPDPGAMPEEEMPGYMQNYAQGGLASLPQISHSGLYRAMGRG